MSDGSAARRSALVPVGNQRSGGSSSRAPNAERRLCQSNPMSRPLAPDLRIAPADARDAGRRAVDQCAPRLRAEVRRHPSPRRSDVLARNGPSVRIWSRLGNEKTTQFPSIVRALETAAAHLRLPLTPRRRDRRARRSGRPAGFQRLQGRIHLKERADVARVDHAQPVALILFDILRDGDEDVRGLPLAERRKRLEAHFGKLTSETHPPERTGRRRRPRAPGAREGRTVGGPDRQGGAVDLPVRQAQPGVAQAQDSARAGVRGRRLDRAAADAPALRRAAARRVRR